MSEVSDADELTEIKSSEQKIIHIEPRPPYIKDLTLPLNPETKSQVQKHKEVQQALIQEQFVAIIEDAQERFMDTHPDGIGLRAIMTSKEGSIDLKAGYEETPRVVVDMRTAVEQGGETTSATLNVGRHEKKTEHINPLDQHRVFQYLINAVGIILNLPDPEGRRKLLPAVLVYNLKKLERDSGYTHSFRDPDNKSEALLALYPLDIVDEAKL